MRASLLLCLMVLPLLLCVARNAHAQIHRCIGAQGEPVFTDQPCGSSELSMDIASDTLDQNQDQEFTVGHATETGPVRFAAACPRSPQQVRDRVAVAFNDDNSNALAGLFDWRGYSHTGANAKLREFSRWLKQPLVGVEFAGALDPSGAQPGDADYMPVNPSGLTVLTQPRGVSAADVRSFGLMQRGGCWWLNF